jgi:DNA-binding transcriptional LysR family regulator
MLFNFRVKVFYTVAQRLSFTKAAQELFITQPAVTKHIKELESELGGALFKRNGNTISLTAEGKLLFRYAEEMFKISTSFENEMGQLKNTSGGILHIGASTTLAQYVLPKILALFKSTYPAVHFTFSTGNSEWIEEQVISGKLDMAIVEGVSHRPQLAYEAFFKDEIVLAVNHSNQLAQKREIKPEVLLSIPLVLREQGSGTLEVVYEALTHVGISPKDLQVEINLGSTESIKQYLSHTKSVAFISLLAITKELYRNELCVVEVKGLEIYRTFQFIQLHGHASPLSQMFKRFCLNHYNI